MQARCSRKVLDPKLIFDHETIVTNSVFNFDVPRYNFDHCQLKLESICVTWTNAARQGTGCSQFIERTLPLN